MYSNTMLLVLKFEKVHSTLSYLVRFFWYICGTTERNFKICVVKSNGKYWMDVTLGHFIRMFMDWNFHIFFLCQNVLSIIMCWRITVAATRLTINPPPFSEEKKIAKLKEFQIANAVKVLGYSNIDIY